MNRWDEIRATARNIASNVHHDPVARDAMADDLIKLVGQVIEAVGNGEAVSEATGADLDLWTHEDRRPDGLKLAAVKAAEADPFGQGDKARPCCYPGGCPTCHNGGPVGRCCYMLREVCPTHGHSSSRNSNATPAAEPATIPTAFGTSTIPQRECCYVAACATCRNAGPIGGCCYPLGDVCPTHC
jgi:hypothetical protein